MASPRGVSRRVNQPGADAAILMKQQPTCVNLTAGNTSYYVIMLKEEESIGSTEVIRSSLCRCARKTLFWPHVVDTCRTRVVDACMTVASSACLIRRACRLPCITVSAIAWPPPLQM